MMGASLRDGRGWMKLLLIEDDVRVAQILAEAFVADGHEPTIRHTGADGLALLARERPVAVVFDVRLPTMGCVSVLRRIRTTAPRPQVILMTGLATRGAIARAPP